MFLAPFLFEWSFLFLLLLVNEAYIPATLNLKLKYTILVLIKIFKNNSCKEVKIQRSH